VDLKKEYYRDIYYSLSWLRNIHEYHTNCNKKNHDIDIDYNISNISNTNDDFTGEMKNEVSGLCGISIEFGLFDWSKMR
jgi:hypothetical protein